MDHSDRLARLGDLTVGVGLNMQPGQIVVILALPEHAPLAREIARAAYRKGASRVDSFYVDRHFAKAHVELGSPETLGEMPPPHRAMQKMLEEEE
ncbi:MAG TPA: aminopeptidase, partial [Candidatus Dormibacteraeota bacterium]|nr:aminopeptidase [Candidatus Dormibacteraeota bacterium]